ncbi:LytR/AlgR family response regulator transcription factor [Lacihabitans lacunae]|uniref:LytR/AlgR family response regulator transcription factor n=1 Tax=Lacihabitans lacunae TaxID=1028214 RepID=A0ABV7Z1J8_9BACT
MKKNILILEDDPLYALKLEMMLEGSEFHIIAIVDNILSAFEYINKTEVDIFVSDLIIDSKPKGIEFIKEISPSNFPIVGITSSLEEDFYNELKDYLDNYLVKPFHKISFFSVLNRALLNFKEKKQHDFLAHKYILLSGKSGRLEKVNFTDIIYLESDINYVTIYTLLGKYAKKISLKRIMKESLDQTFLRIHHKYVINSAYISVLNLKEVILNNGLTFPVSRSFLENIKRFINQK